jgi:ABC-2 type transport system permease protein
MTAPAITSPAPANAEPSRIGWGFGAVAVLHREYRLLTRNRTNLLLAMLPTAVYLLLFATSLNHLIGTVGYAHRRISYAEFTVPALMLSSMLAAATTAGTSLFQERLGRMEIELWSYPMRRSGYVFGKLLASTALVLGQTIAALLVALLLFNFDWPLSHWFALLAGTTLASVAFNGLYLLAASAFRDFQRFMVTINVLAPVLLFASPSFYPADQMAAPKPKNAPSRRARMP